VTPQGLEAIENLRIWADYQQMVEGDGEGQGGKDAKE
jgi:hypothetical protein